MQDVVNRQVNIGIDIVDDGEMGEAELDHLYLYGRGSTDSRRV